MNPEDSAATPLKPQGASSSAQRWAWWPLLPLYPYGRRPTLVCELLKDRIWTFEQLHGVWYVAVPIRMSVLKVREGLLLYAPLAPTAEVLAHLRLLEAEHGPVCTIVLPTASGLEHKLPVPAMARAFPDATVWITQRQWSFPLNLPNSWLGFPIGRTRVLFDDGLPHPDQLDWIGLGPLDLGLGTFVEVACFNRATGTLLVTDALLAIPKEPPPVFDLDPTPLLFHARESGNEPLLDNHEHRRKGWMRTVLFASYLRPLGLEVPSWQEILGHAFSPGCRTPKLHFGFYPFRWKSGWESEFETLTSGIGVAPVLERLVFPRSREPLLAWIRKLAALEGVERLVAAHYARSQPITGSDLARLATELEGRDWPRETKAMQTLGRIDHWLLQAGLVPRG